MYGIFDQFMSNYSSPINQKNVV